MSHRLKYILGAVCYWWLVKLDMPLDKFTLPWAGYYAHSSWKTNFAETASTTKETGGNNGLDQEG